MTQRFNPKMFLLIILCLISPLMGQDIEQAKALVTDGKIEEAIVIYREAYAADPDNNFMAYTVAQLSYQIKDYKMAIKYYEILAPNGNPTVLYNLACSYALAGKKRKAIKALKQAVDNGFNQVSLMRTDPDLESIRDHKKFESIVSSAKSIENIPEAQAFNFWVGEWEVFNPSDQKMGDSRIEKILKNAVILENWTGASGYTGKSFNHYHIESGKWIQYWVDQASGRIHYEGNYDPELKAIVFYEVHPEGLQLKRLSFYNLGFDTVRQHSELRTTEDESWVTEYDFTYIRKPQNPK